MTINAEFMSRANCKGLDPSDMVPEARDRIAVQAAKRVCRNCVVQADCLEYALEVRDFEGVLGATTGRERKRILAHRLGLKVIDCTTNLYTPDNPDLGA